MPMELQGFDNLKDDLTNMASNLEFGAGVNRALQEGAKPIEEQMLHNAASDPQIITGALHGSIRTHSVRKSRSGGKYITIGVSIPKRARTMQTRSRKATAALRPLRRIPSCARLSMCARTRRIRL